MTDSSSPLTTVIQSEAQPIYLRTPALSDTAALQVIFSKPANVEFDASARRTPPTTEGITSMITAMRDGAAASPPTRANLVIVSAATDDVIGIAGLGRIRTRDGGTREGNAGVLLNPEWRGPTEALRMSVKFGFRRLGLDEVGVGTLEINERMVKVMDRLGWEGKRQLDEDGTREVVYLKLRSEWEVWKEKAER
ncbi:MAG: hypothetical protein M1818_001679 [Claussenomyces sp. TS43310]|nr:MAG: hypothetical protein M1818_001679 [Claussenomyces sp. TS43310]